MRDGTKTAADVERGSGPRPVPNRRTRRRSSSRSCEPTRRLSVGLRAPCAAERERSKGSPRAWRGSSRTGTPRASSRCSTWPCRQMRSDATCGSSRRRPSRQPRSGTLRGWSRSRSNAVPTRAIWRSTWLPWVPRWSTRLCPPSATRLGADRERNVRIRSVPGSGGMARSALLTPGSWRASPRRASRPRTRRRPGWTSPARRRCR